MKETAARCILTVVALVCLALDGCHPSRTETQILAADHFAVDGLYIGMPEEEFKRVCSVDSDDPMPIPATRSYTGGTPHVSVVVACLQDKKAISFACLYSPEQVKGAGGWETYFERLKERLGNPDSVSHHKDSSDDPHTDYAWFYPRLKRGINLDVGSAGVSLNFSDTDFNRKTYGNVGY